MIVVMRLIVLLEHEPLSVTSISYGLLSLSPLLMTWKVYLELTAKFLDPTLGNLVYNVGICPTLQISTCKTRKYTPTLFSPRRAASSTAFGFMSNIQNIGPLSVES